MDDRDKTAFAEAMTALSAAYRRDVDPLTKRVYFDACKDRMTIDEFRSAVARAIQTSKFFPTPAELLPHGNPLASALEAYQLADRTMAQHGSYRAVDFEDKAINATIRSLGGWDAFGAVPMSQEPGYRQLFIKTYQAFAMSGVSYEAGRPLIGLAEASEVTRDEVGAIETQKLVPIKIAKMAQQQLPQPTQARIGCVQESS